MSSEEPGVISGIGGATAEIVPHLTRRDIDRLTAYKWRYSLETHGFSTAQAHRLLFMRWLYGRGAVVS
jgi:hypothetical protein